MLSDACCCISSSLPRATELHNVSIDILHFTAAVILFLYSWCVPLFWRIVTLCLLVDNYVVLTELLLNSEIFHILYILAELPCVVS